MAENKNITALLLDDDQLSEILQALARQYKALQKINKIMVEIRNVLLEEDNFEAAKKIESNMKVYDKSLGTVRHLIEYIAERV